MQTWFAIFLGRLLGGERLEKATPYDYRLWLGILFLTPVLMTLFMKAGKSLFDASTLILWVGVTMFGLVTLIAVLAWARFVPARVSLGLAFLSWTAFIWLSPFK